jgi:hypothetical protein
MSADAAVETCSALADAGSASLVIFDDNEQREQVFYELMRLPVAPDGGPPTDFWIGLTYQRTHPGGALEWVWDDLGKGRPLQWGEHEPTATQEGGEGVRAYASQSSNSYDTPAANFDTQLWHAHDPPDAGTEVHGVLCQILQ